MVRRRAVALLAAAAAAAGAETSACKRGAPRGITLVTQTSVERLRNLRSICERWTGDISVAVYVEDAVEERRMAPTVDAVTRPCRRAAIAFVRAAAPDEEYPVNRLRNVAWRGAATSHVFVVDVDFWPGAGARAALEAAVAAAGERTAIVAPAFSLDFRGETRFDGDGQRLGPLWGGEKTRTVNGSEVPARAGKESEIPNFKGSYLSRFPLVLADFWTSDHLSERSRSVDAFSGTRARGTLMLKRT